MERRGMGWKVMLACREGNFKTALQLIRDGVNPNLSRDEDGWSPLHYACKEGNLHFIVTLVQKYGCDLEYQTLHTRREGDCIIRAGSTPLHVACSWGHLDVVRYLTSHCLNVQCTDECGQTPLYLACLNQYHFNTAWYLISDWHCSVKLGQYRAQALLEWAHQKDVLKHSNSEQRGGIILEKGDAKDVLLWAYDNGILLQLISEQLRYIILEKGEAVSLFQWTTSNHHFQIAWYLFGGKGCGIKPGQTDTQALLDWARQENVLQYLNYEQLNRMVLEKDDATCQSLMLWAIQHCHFEIACYLIREKHCSVKLREGAAYALLDWSHRNDVLQHLEHGSIILNQCDAEALLLWASKVGYLKVVKFLLNKGSLKCTDGDGYTPVDLACRNHCGEVAWFLIMEKHCSVKLGHSDAQALLEWAHREGVLQNLNSEQLSRIILEKDDAEALLLWASRNHHFAVAWYLIREKHCSVEHRKSDAQALLDWAHRKGVLQELKIEQLRHIKLKKDDARALLLWASQNHHFEVAWYLISEQQCSVKLGHSDAEALLDWAHRTLGVLQHLNSEHLSHIILEKDDAQALLLWASKKHYFEVAWYLITEQNCSVKLILSDAQALLDWAERKGVLQYIKSEHLRNILLEKNDAKALLLWASRNHHFEVAWNLIMEKHCSVKLGQSTAQALLDWGHRKGVLQHLKSEQLHRITLERDDTGTPLLWPSQNHHFEVAWYLIGNQQCIKFGHSDALPLMHWIHRKGIMQYLSTDLLCRIVLEKDDATAVLKWASQNHHFVVAWHVIIAECCSVELGQSDAQALLDWAHQEAVLQHLYSHQHCHIILEKDDAETLLLWASQNYYYDVAWYLISKQCCSIELGESDAQALLDWAHKEGVLKSLNSGQLRRIKLEKNDAEILLLWACRGGHFEVVKSLMSVHNCDLTCSDADGQNPVHLACWWGHLEVVKYLTSEQHLNLEDTDDSGHTPLHLACLEGQHNIVHHLLSEMGCNANSKTKDGRTPLSLTHDPSTIRELLRYGANPENVYTNYSGHLPEHCPKRPTESAVKTFTVGNPGAGKTTLVRALEKEGNWFSGRLIKVSGVDEKTAGIIPHKIQSRTFGHIILYDFAGHQEFYASHAAMIRQSMAGSSAAIFLLLADLRSSDEDFRRSILSWLSLIDNQCPSTDPKPHIIVVGSHADEVKPKTEIAKKSGIVDSLVQTAAFANLQFTAYVTLNCCYSASGTMKDLREHLKRSCKALRLKSDLNFNTHCFFLYLLDKFRDHEAVQVKDVLIKLKINSAQAAIKPGGNELLSFIPTEFPDKLCEMCEDLHERGSILLLKNSKNPEHSWIILDQDTLLSQVTGTVFAPEGFKQHRDLANCTGVVPFTKLQDHFFSLNPDMLTQLLCHLEFCQEVTDHEVLKLLQAHDAHLLGDERVFFFPALVSIDAPKQVAPTEVTPAEDAPLRVWEPSDDFGYHSGWVLQCKPEKFYSPRFLQVLLLRLAFSFALTPNSQEINADLPTIKRKCDVWKSGIFWSNRDGIEVLVEVHHSQAVHVLLRCLNNREVDCIQLRSAVIQKVLNARKEFCPRVSSVEALIHPKDIIHYPLKPATKLRLFSIAELTKAIIGSKPCVVGESGPPMNLEKLLYYEPYAHLKESILQRIFEQPPNCEKEVSDAFLYEMADCIHTKMDYFVKMLKPQASMLQNLIDQAPPGSTHAIVRVFQLWRLRSSQGSYHCLRNELDQFSMFAGRNPLDPELTEESIPALDSLREGVLQQINSDQLESVNVQKDDDPETQMLLASKEGRLEVIKYLISEQNFDLEKCTDKDGNTPLDLACQNEHFEVAWYLIHDQHCSVKLGQSDAQALLEWAHREGVLQHLNSKQLSCIVLEKDDAEAVLLWASKEGHLEVVQHQLREKNSNLECTDSDGRTPVEVACWYRHFDVAWYLIKEKDCSVKLGQYDAQALLDWANQKGVLPQLSSGQNGAITLEKEDPDILLLWASLEGHLEVVKYLLCKQRCNLKCTDSSGQTPVYLACRNHHFAVAWYLISDQHCSVKLGQSDAQPLLDWAHREGVLSSAQHSGIVLKKDDAEAVLLWASKEGIMQHLQHGGILLEKDDAEAVLIWASERGHLEVVKYLICVQHSNLECRDKDGQTPLCLACRRGHLEVVKYLICVQHCNLECRDKDGQTPLCLACRYRHFDVTWYLMWEKRCSIKLGLSDAQAFLGWAHRKGVLQHLNSKQHGSVILEKDVAQDLLLWASQEDILQHLNSEQPGGITLEKDDDAESVLLWASKSGYLEVVKYLTTAQHCNVECSDADGQTSVGLACRWGHLEVVKYLTSVQHCNLECTDDNGQTLLGLACRYQHFDVAWYLIWDMRCSVQVGLSDAQALLEWAHRKGVLQHLNSKQHGGVILEKDDAQVLLLWASQKGILQQLKSEQHGGIVLKKDDAEAVLLWASQEGHLVILKYVLSAYHCNLECTDYFGRTPLHLACRHGHLEVVKFLMSEQNLNLEKTDDEGRTPLHLSCQEGCLEVVKYMLSEQHCNLQSTDKEERTPLHLACWEGHLEVVKYLKKAQQCNMENADGEGQTPLQVACRRGHAKIAHYLLSDTNCNINGAARDATTPLSLNDNPSIIRELVHHRANPENISSHLPEHFPKQSTECVVKVFAVGDHGTGKTTLVKSLEKESSGLARIPGWLVKVSRVDQMTAGIIPHRIESQTFGRVILYDCAGYKEFHASHAAMIRQSVADSSAAIFLLLADLRSSDEDFRKSILFWLSLIDNQCPLTDPKPHIIIVGSHADEVKSRAEITNKSSIVNALVTSAAFTNLYFSGHVLINCCYSESASISELRQHLARSCNIVKVNTDLRFSAHCLFLYLLDKFQNHAVVTLTEVLAKILVSDDKHLLSFIPMSIPGLYTICEELNERGNILFLKNTSNLGSSAVVLDQASLISRVTGTVFAPEGFKQHRNVASNTGVVLFSALQKHFPDVDMVVRLLCNLEFCREVTNHKALQLLQTTTNPQQDEERAFFFPALVSIEAPNQVADIAPVQTAPLRVWEASDDFAYHSGWILQCSQGEHFFTPRFLQVLSLRLAFSFALTPDTQSDPQAIQRKFHVWKSGIFWRNEDGVEVLVEVHQSQVNVLLRCLVNREIDCIHLRSAVIQIVLKARQEFCHKVNTSEFFIHLSDATQYPLKPATELRLFSISEVAKAITAGEHCRSETPINFEELLYCEPYAYLGENILQTIFDESNCEKQITDVFLYQMADCVRTKMEHFIKMLKPPTDMLQRVMEQASPSSTHTIVRLFQLWRRQSGKGTYQCLRKELDRFSIFAGRNPLASESNAQTLNF